MVALVKRVCSVLDPYATLSYAQEGEDVVLCRLLEGQTVGFYIDVGAHHPMRFSNTYLFYQRGWAGINIDPNPNGIRAFRDRRPRDINLNVGISEDPGTLPYYRFSEAALNTFDEALVRQREHLEGYRLVDVVKVPVVRLDRVLGQHLPKGQEIDFLSVDTEGHDLKVLRSNDWSQFRPRYVLVEALQLSFSSLAENPVHRFLSSHDYEFVAKTVNTLFYVRCGDYRRSC